MGEEAKQEEAVKGGEAPPVKEEEKPAVEEKKDEEKKEEAKPSPPPPPPPIVLFVGLHCAGCAKKIQRFILKCRGVEAVETNIEKNEVIVRGAVDPQALCTQLRKKTSRNAKLLSPVPPPPAVDAPDPNNSESKAAPSQVSGVSTVELLVNMHCQACAQQLRKKILKMRGVQVAETDLTAKKVTVIGTMNEDKLVEYIHRRTGKFAKINPPAAPLEEKKVDDAKKPEEAEKKIDDEKGTDEKKEEAALKKVEANSDEKTGGDGGGNEPKKEEQAASSIDQEMMKRMMYWNGPSGYMHEDDMAKRVVMMHHWMPMPMPMPMPSMLMPTSTMYPLEVQPRMPPPPPPQLFSDENPNACCIS